MNIRQQDFIDILRKLDNKLKVIIFKKCLNYYNSHHCVRTTLESSHTFQSSEVFQTIQYNIQLLNVNFRFTAQKVG